MSAMRRKAAKRTSLNNVFWLNVHGAAKVPFEARLDDINRRAIKRLHERMRWAYSRRRLDDYLAQIGFAYEGAQNLERAELVRLSQKLAVLLASRIRHARKKGYLKDYLRFINMQDLLW